MRNTIRFNPADFPLASKVVSDPRLFALLDADEVAPLVAAVEAAERAAKAATSIPFAGDATANEVHATIRSGKDVDAAKTIAKMTTASAAKAAHVEAQNFLRDLPRVYRHDLAAFIEESKSDLYRGLSAQLDELLGRADGIAAALAGAYDAESALDAGLADEFKAFRQLGDEYASLRESHLSLLRAEDDLSFTVGSTAIAHAYFGHIADVYPEIVQTADTSPRGWKTSEGEPFPITDAHNRAHWVYVATRREALRPHVVTVAQAIAQRDEAFRTRTRHEGEFMPSNTRQATEYYGGEAHAMSHALGHSVGGSEIVSWGFNRPQ